MENIEPELRNALLENGFVSKLDEVKKLLKKVDDVLPLNLMERNDDFELDNGGLLILLSQSDCTYKIVKDFEEFDVDYDTLSDCDLDEIIHILENVDAENEKAFKRSQS